ncbi:MAG: Gfo/Idh/MocA family oxidoreductase [Ruminococcaceae bacterium]|nr:Gfo/Idh/MocA family oxidoreductase [Oscillospiraceae bacterium]
MLKVGVLGVGGISGAHITAWPRIEGAELVALCDIRPERLEKYKDSPYHLYTSYEDMIANEELDIIDICLPTYLHVEYSIKSMEKGMHVICEKPISLNREDVKRVYDTAKKMGVKFMVAQVLRFWSEYVFVKDLVDSGKYGKLLNGYVERMGDTPKWSWDGWMADPDRSGLVPFDLHIHDLDWLIYTFGAPKNISVKRVQKCNNDYMNGIYEYDDFFISAQSAWYAGKYKFSYGFRFTFEEATVELKNEKLTIYQNDCETIEVNNDVVSTETCINLPATDAYFDEIKYFTECILEDKPTDKIKPEELEYVLDILKQY